MALASYRLLPHKRRQASDQTPLFNRAAVPQRSTLTQRQPPDIRPILLCATLRSEGHERPCPSPHLDHRAVAHRCGAVHRR